MSKKPKIAPKLVRLDLACGNNKQKDFIGVDQTKKGTQADVECNLMTFPWPWGNNSVDEVFASHYLEHIPHGDGFNDPFFKFFDEVYRILKKGGIARFVFPYYTSVRAFQDPTHLRFLGEPTFLYLTKPWRKINKLEFYPVKCNFEIVKFDHAVSEEFAGRPQEAVQYAASHYWNVVNDLVVILKKA